MARSRGKDGRFVSNGDILDAMEPLATIRLTEDGKLMRHSRKKTRFDAGRRKRFLAALATTSNVRDSARKAGVNSSTAYYRRNIDRDFADAWDVALDEGHVLLQLEMLHRARFGTRSRTTESDREGMKKEIEKIDFRDSVGLHLLTRYDRKMTRGSSAPRGSANADDADALDRLCALLDIPMDTEGDVA